MQKIGMAILTTFIVVLMSGCSNNGVECDECGGSHHVSDCEAGI